MAGCFCCCCSPKDGTETLLYITMVMWGYIFYFNYRDYREGEDHTYLYVATCFLLCKIAGIYGIYQKIPGLLIPQMIIQGIIMVALGIFAYSWIFKSREVAYGRILMDSFNGKKISYGDEGIYIYSGGDVHIINPAVPALILLAIQYDLFSVVRGYYKQMREELEERNALDRVQIQLV